MEQWMKEEKMEQVRTMEQNEDKEIICVDCGLSFTFPVGEQVFYWSKGLSEPKRCKICRMVRKRNTKVIQEKQDNDKERTNQQ